MSPEAFPYDVFLSHSAQDKAVVRPQAERLRQDGLKVWFDEWALKHEVPLAHRMGEGSGVRAAKIKAGLDHSHMLVLCMSANAFGSDWTQLVTHPQPSTLNPQPTGAPLNQERHFIPLRLDDTPINADQSPSRYAS